MNHAYLSKFWPEFRIIVAAGPETDGLPPPWRALARADADARLEGFRDLARSAFRHMPETLALLEARTTDAYLVQVGADVALVADRLLEGETYSYRGFAPRAEPPFGGSVGAFYRLLDGFCDFHDFGGLLPLRAMRPLGEDGCEFWTEPSAALFEAAKGKGLVHVFSAGATSEGYLDVASTRDGDPGAVLLWTDEEEPLVDVDFWDLFDHWTCAALE